MSVRLLFPALGLLLIAMGWPLAARRIGPNRWYGLRVPATFADKHVWYEANAVGGRSIVILGVVLGLVALILPSVMPMPDATYTAVCAGIMGVGSLMLTVRGWRLANRLLRERRGAADMN